MRRLVVAVASSPIHGFSKAPRRSVRLLAGLGVEGEAHAGVTVKHRSRVPADPTRPNLRQVHRVHAELLHELRENGCNVEAGAIGENALTVGIDLLALPAGTQLRLGSDAVMRVNGLRNPGAQLDRHQKSLAPLVVGRAADGSFVRKAGILGIVLSGGAVRPGDSVDAVLPPLQHRLLDRV